MIITCKECNASFKLDESLLKPTGSKVRCSKCNEIFTAYPPKTSEAVETPDETALDIEDQQVAQDLDAEKKEIPVPDDLDLSDLDESTDKEEAPESVDITDDDTEGLDLDLDLEPETKKEKEDLEVEADHEEPGELDLSDLENLLDEEEVPTGDDAADETVEDLELDLDMEPEPDTAVEKTPPSTEPEELDELDLSDLEEILDLDEPTTEEKSVPDDIELELDMETEPELEKAPETDEDLEEVDLSEIEKMLEVEETEAEVTEEPVEKAPELELEVEETPADLAMSEDSSQVEVFELDEGKETVSEPEAAADAVTLDEPETIEDAVTDELKTEFEVGEGEEGAQAEDEVVEEEPLVEETTPAKKRGVSKPLIVLLILALLAGGSYGTYVLLDFMNIEIPFISDYFKPKVSDPNGSLKIDTLDVNNKFLLNVKEGKLFVITGKIKNGYPDVRRFVKINGKLYKKGKVLAQTESVFCGNILSDIELSNLELEAIKKRLSNRVGDNKSNMLIKPGGELPFMLIFSNLPDDLEEFSIEVAGSMSAE